MGVCKRRCLVIVREKKPFVCCLELMTCRQIIFGYTSVSDSIFIRLLEPPTLPNIGGLMAEFDLTDDKKNYMTSQLLT